MSEDKLARYGLHPHPPEVLDSSMLKDFVDCPSLFYHRHILGQRLRNAKSAALDWGSKWHHVMYTLHHEWDLDAAMEELEADWPKTCNEQDPKNRTKERMKNLLLEYYEKYYRLDNRMYETLRREEYFEIHCGPNDSCPFGGCDWSWCGRMDRIVKNNRGRILVWDYKTTSWLRSSFFSELKHGFQVPGYVWAAMHLTHGRVHGAQADVLHTIKSSNDFHRRELRYTEGEIREWLENARTYKRQIDTMLEASMHDPESWPKNWNHCDRFGGCQFKVIHHLAPIRDTRLQILEEDYEEDRWNPADLVEEVENG